MRNAHHQSLASSPARTANPSSLLWYKGTHVSAEAPVLPRSLCSWAAQQAASHPHHHPASCWRSRAGLQGHGLIEETSCATGICRAVFLIWLHSLLHRVRPQAVLPAHTGMEPLGKGLPQCYCPAARALALPPGYLLWFTYCHRCQFSCYHQTYPGAADFACLLSQLLAHLHTHFPVTRTKVIAGNLSLMRAGTTMQSKSLAPAVAQCPFAVFKQRRYARSTTLQY